MAKKIVFNDILTKVSNVFKADMYLLDYQFCLGGKESEDSTSYTSICILSPEAIELVKEMFPNNKDILFTNVKKAKTELAEYSKTDLSKTEIDNIIKRKESILQIVNNINTWNSFDFTEETWNDIIKEGKTIEMFENDDTIPTVLIGKSVFPMVTVKNTSNLYYQLIKPKNEYDLYKLVTSFDTELFQIYTIIQYLKLD